MSQSLMENADFSGGMNKQASRHAVAASELRDLQDGLLDELGTVRRRGPFTDRMVDGNFTQLDGIVGMGRYSYNKQAMADILIRAYEGGTEFWMMHNDEAPKLIYRYAHGEATHGMVVDGWTPPPSDDEDSAFRNARNNVALIGTDQVTVALKLLRGADFDGDPGTYQFRPEMEGSDFAELTLISASANVLDPQDTGRVIKPRLLTDVQRTAGPPYPVADIVASTGLYSFAAGMDNLPQHMAWSKGQNSHVWTMGPDPNDLRKGGFEHFPGGNNSHIMGLVPLGGNLLILKRQALLAMRFLSADPANGGWPVKQVAAVGPCDTYSVQKWREQLLFADENGLWVFDGAQAQNISEPKIGRYWRELTAGWTSNWKMRSALYKDVYLLAIYDEDMQHKGTLLFDLRTGAWSRISGLDFVASCESPHGTTVYVALRSGRIVNLRSMFDRISGQDVVGTGPTFVLETGAMTPSSDPLHYQRFRRCYLNYEATAGTGPTPELTLEYALGADPTPVWHELPALPAKDVQGPEERWFTERSPALALRITDQTGSAENFGSVRITAIGVGFRSMRQGRVRV